MLPSDPPENYVAVTGLHGPAAEKTERWDGWMEGGREAVGDDNNILPSFQRRHTHIFLHVHTNLCTQTNTVLVIIGAVA